MKEPDAKTDAALRWGQYVVQHFQPSPGSLVLITHSGTTSAHQKAGQMADAIEKAVDKSDHSEDVVIGTVPNSYAVKDLPTSKMNPCGWYHKSQLSDDERTRLESDKKDHA